MRTNVNMPAHGCALVAVASSVCRVGQHMDRCSCLLVGL